MSPPTATAMEHSLMIPTPDLSVVPAAMAAEMAGLCKVQDALEARCTQYREWVAAGHPAL